MDENKNSDNNSNMDILQTQVGNQIKQEDETFNKLKKIQNLLKKESALKNLCKSNNIYNIFNI